MQKVMIIPGNGGKQISSIWYPSVKTQLSKLKLEVFAKDMPDPTHARSKFWLPFIKENTDKNSILIGYSSGAAAALRHLEQNPCSLLILIGTYHTDLNMESEKQSGYFDEPWDWEAIKANANKIVIFTSTDDPFIPIEEARFIRDQLSADYHEFNNEGHFNTKLEFPEIITTVSSFLEERN